MTWPLVELGQISHVDYGVTASAEPEPVGPRFLRITDIQDDSVDWNAVPFCHCDNKELTSSRLYPGDILFARTGATTGKSFLVRNVPERTIFASYLIRVRPDKVVLPTYLAHFFKSKDYWLQIEKHKRGAGQPGVNSTTLKTLQVPLPPLVEQQRIAAILDKAENLRAKRRAALDLLDQLPQAIFLEMFGDPVLNPRYWRIHKLCEVGTLDRGVSKHRPRNAPELLGGIHPLIQTGDVANSEGYIRSFSSTYSDLGLKQSKKWPRGTLCITIAANIAKTGILQFEACFPDSVVGFTAFRPESTEYARIWLSFLQKTLEDTAPESAQKNINLEILRNLPIPVPPPELLQRFAAQIARINRVRVTSNPSIREADALFDSLQARVFGSK